MIPRVIPVLLLSEAGLVKTVKFKKGKYIGDPINALRVFNEKEVDEIAVLDIDAQREQRGPDFARIEALAGECFMPLAYGGGIKTIDHIRTLFRLGVEKVILNSVTYLEPRLLQQAAELHGNQSIVACIDVRKNWRGKYQVYHSGGSKNAGVDLTAHALKMEAHGCGEIILNSIDQDGTMDGYDLPLIKTVSSLVQIPVVASGGAGQLTDFRQAIQAGASAAAAGSFFVFHGRHRAVLVTYPRRSDLERLFQEEK